MNKKTVVVGAGWISHCHAKALQEIGVEISGVYDVNKEIAERFAEQYGTKAISSLDEVLDEVDMVHLLTPPSKRLEYAEKAMRAGKHLFIEKPIAISMEDARKILALAEENHVKLLVGFNHRYRKGYQMLYEAVKSGKLGQPVNVFSHRLGAGSGFRESLKASWRTDPDLVCGMSVESLSHDIDMLLPLVEGVEAVSAELYGTVKSLPAFDNNSNVVFRLKEGGIGTIHASWSSDIPYSARGFIGTKGSAIIRGNGLWDFEEFVIKTEEMEQQCVYRVNETFASTMHQSYVNIQKHFIDCIEQNIPEHTGGKNGLDALAFALAILESAHTGKEIVLSEL